jgi:catechol 2,3-dioxygenase-like lactoylglutathione lyase family enzyme
MKRFHVHVGVSDLESSIKFYSTLFGRGPTVVKPDYAKWMLDDPRVNFAISMRATEAAIDHLGFQVESDGELAEIGGRLAAAGAQVIKQENATCCYARGNKGWVADPSGISWETFHTMGESEVRGNDLPELPETFASTACCAPKADGTACCGASKAE